MDEQATPYSRAETDERVREAMRYVFQCTSGAMGLVVGCLLDQLDAERFANLLRQRLEAAKSTGLLATTTILLATEALAAADAEILTKRQGSSKKH